MRLHIKQLLCAHVYGLQNGNPELGLRARSSNGHVFNALFMHFAGHKATVGHHYIQTETNKNL